MATDKEAPQPEINEAFLREWVNYGFAELHVYLVKHAEFDKWLNRQPPKKEEQDGSTGTP